MAGGMHFLVGLRTDDYVILAADKSAFAFGAIVVSQEENKEFQLGDKLYMTVVGETGDVANFGDWAKRNLYLYKLRNGYELTPQAAHHWLRRNIAENLRSQDAWRVDLLIGGFSDHEKKAFLGSVDYLGNGIADQNYLFRGFSGRFCYAIMDAEYKPTLSLEEGLDLVKKCLGQTKKRFIANLPNFSVLVIDKNGARHHADVSF